MKRPEMSTSGPGVVSNQRASHPTRPSPATLLIAKLDRLSRNAAFVLTLRDSGVRFVAADMPEAHDLTGGIMALVAEQEREAISRRTREALSVARSHGVKPRQPTAARRSGGQGRAVGRCARPSDATPTDTRRTSRRAKRSAASRPASRTTASAARNRWSSSEDVKAAFPARRARRDGRERARRHRR